MDQNSKLITDEGVVKKKDIIGDTTILVSRILIILLAVLGGLALYYA